MSTFYTIVMLMLIVLPPVFKAIEKSLSKAGEEEKARQIKKIRDLLSDDKDGGDLVSVDGEPTAVPQYAEEEFPMFSYETDDSAAESPSAHKEKIKDLPPELIEGGYMSVKDIVRKRNEAYARQSQPVETENSGTHKIDPRKLVLYSELMKTKF